MEKFSRRELSPGIYLNSIKDDRFKSCKISVNMYMPMTNDTAAENALLIQLLGRSCREYPDYMSLNREVNRLYGASIGADCTKIGDLQQLVLSVSGLDDRYALNGEKLSQELVKLLCKMLFEPKLEGEAFAQYDTQQERRKLLELIESEINEKRGYAITQCVSLMCENDSFGIRRYGSYEQVKAVTPQQLYTAWKRLLETAVINIVVVGSPDAGAIGEMFSEKFSTINRRPENYSTRMFKLDSGVKEKTEEQEVMQSKLVMGFACNIDENDPNSADCAKLMTLVLGGTPSSKLFTNVREKESLCYYCAASYNRQKSIVLIDCGVEKQNVEKAKKEILNQLEQMKKGNISEFEINAAKLAVADSSGIVTDSIGGIDKFYTSQLFEKEIITPEQAAERINAVTAKQLVEAANCVELAAVYLLTDNKEEL